MFTKNISDKKRIKQIVVIITSIIISFIIMFSEIPSLSMGAKITLALFSVVALFWMSEIIPLYVTSLIILGVEIIFIVPTLKAEGIAVTKETFMSPFFSNIILLFLGGLLLSKAGSKYRIDNWIAQVVMRLVGGRPSFVLLGLILTSAWLSMWMSNTATTAMMLLIAIAISKDLPENTLKFKKALFLGVPFACNLGGMGTPVGSPPNAIALVFMEKAGIHISFLQWMLATIPFVLLLLIILWRVLLIFYPAPKELLILKGDSSFPSNPKALGTAVIFAITVLLWLTGKIHGLSSGTVGLLAAIFLLAFNILDSKDFRNISWDLLYLVGGGVSLGLAMSKSGLSLWLMELLPLNNVGAFGIYALFIFAGVLMTTFMSNTATANILIPLAVSIQSDIAPLIMGAALAVSASMSLPVSTPPNAISYYSGEIELKDMFKTGVLISIISAVILIAGGKLYWNFLGF